MISTIVALPYELARKPLAVANEKLSGRLPESVSNRVDRALGSADRLAGTLLGNPEIAQRGADRVERSTKLLTAARLEREAEDRREVAGEIRDAGLEEAARRREAAQDRAVSGLDEAEAAEVRGKQEAKERAEDTAAAKKAAAAKRAATRKRNAERGKQQVTSVADAKQKTAQKRAKAELDDAREDQAAAEKARADAEQLSELTEAKKKARKKS